MSVMLEFSMFPVGRGESLSADVARLVKIVRDSGLDYRFGPMGTTIEADADAVFDVVKRCLADLQTDAARVAGSIKLDWRAGRSGGLDGKVASVQRRLDEADRA